MSAIAAHIRARALVQKASELLDVDIDDILGDGRGPLLCEIRWGIMRVMKDEGYTETQIGRMLQKDPSGVYHSLKRANNLMDNSYFSGFVEALR